MKKKRLLKPAGGAKQKSKTRPPTEVERKMGQIVVDFANAETSDAACFKHFENVQELMEDFFPDMAFSPDFTERTKEKYSAFFQPFPGISLTDPEREFIRLTSAKPGLQINIYTLHRFDRIRDNVEAGSLFWIKCYIPETSKLTILSYDHDTSPWQVAEGYLSKETPREMTFDEFKDEIKKTGTNLSSKYWDHLDEFVEMEKQLSTLKHSISESRLNELEEISAKIDSDGQDNKLQEMHGNIKDLQKNLQNILNGIAENKYLNDLNGLAELVEIYSLIPKKVVITADLLLESPSISEEYYFRDYVEWYAYQEFSRFQVGLVYCLIEFLKAEGNRKYIGKCLNCEKYFIAAKYNPVNPSKFCRYNGDKCRFDWHNKRKIESGEAAKYMKDGRAEGKYQ